MTLYLLKVLLQTFLSIPITQKCQILSCNTCNKRTICPQIVFEVEPSRSSYLSPLVCIYGDTLKLHWIQLQLKMYSHFTKAMLLPVKPFAIGPGPWKDVTFHDQTCLNLHSFRWRIFGAFVVFCDLINNKNSTVMKLGTCIVNVLCQL
jgi:hypothetical protein